MVFPRPIIPDDVRTWRNHGMCANGELFIAALKTQGSLKFAAIFSTPSLHIFRFSKFQQQVITWWKDHLDKGSKTFLAEFEIQKATSHLLRT